MHGLRLERIRASARYADGSFHNLHPVSPGLKKGTVAPTLKEYLCGGQRRTPPGPLPSVSPLERWAQPVETGLRATWLGHSTVLVELDGARVLTDPVWGERVSPVSFAGPKRFQPVPVSLDALPALDAVIVSHDHFDHLDVPSLRHIGPEATFVTPLGCGKLLRDAGLPNVIELDRWQEADVHGLRVRLVPAQHWCMRAPWDRNKVGMRCTSKPRLAMIGCTLLYPAWRPHWRAHSFHLPGDSHATHDSGWPLYAGRWHALTALQGHTCR